MEISLALPDGQTGRPKENEEPSAIDIDFQGMTAVMRPALARRHASTMMEREPGYFATHRVERRQYDGLGRVVDYNFNTCSRLESADVAAFAADYATLDLVGVYVEYGDSAVLGDGPCDRGSFSGWT